MQDISQNVSLTRRKFLRGLTATGLVGVSIVGAYATLVEPYYYELTNTDIFILDLPESFDNFRVAHITDVHHSRLVSIEEVARVVEITAAAKPDMVALTGDYTTSRRRYIEPCAEALSALTRVAPAGVWAVLGNHDHYTDGELTVRAFKRRGINVLENANRNLRRGGEALQLIGIDDWGWGKSDWGRALDGVDLARPTVLLSHEPAVFEMPQTRGLSLILSGHTHGGQISLPFVGPPARHVKEFKYVRGLYEREGTQLYVSRGTGLTGLPVRFGARPEIAVLRLRRREK
ncbi:MAG TPA: metallophosphoesterase [Pyrinomonadaceae bacterium]|nr:metallophosphoesterase [Pyrinomonadaceae bacterium]